MAFGIPDYQESEINGYYSNHREVVDTTVAYHFTMGMNGSWLDTAENGEEDHRSEKNTQDFRFDILSCAVSIVIDNPLKYVDPWGLINIKFENTDNLKQSYS
jgi:hypothetical protein